MQIISLATAATGAVNAADLHLVFTRLAEFAQREEVRGLLRLYLACIAVGEILGIVWHWIASKLVVGGERASFGNAFKLWVIFVALGVAYLALFIFAGPVLAAQAGAGALVAVFGGATLLMLLLAFLIPMKIYEIGFLRALGFIVVTVVISMVGNGVVNFALGNAFGVPARIAALTNSLGKTDAERKAFADRLFGKDAPDEIDRLLDDAAQPIGNPKPLAERETAIQTIQQKLETRRRALPPGDQKALAAFQPRFDRYIRLLNQVKADRAAQTAAPKKP